MKNVLIGVAAGIALVLVGGFALLTLFSGPELSVRVSVPETVQSGVPFRARLDLSNPHDEVVTLDSVDVDNSVFDHFELISVDPTPVSDMSLAGFDQHSWSFLTDLQPGERRIIEFELTPEDVGTFQLGFDVCNSYQDCSRSLLAVTVVHPGSL